MTTKQPVHVVVIDHEEHTCAEGRVTGIELKRLAGVDPENFNIWQVVDGPEDVPVGDDDEIDLTGPDKKCFFTGKPRTTEG